MQCINWKGPNRERCTNPAEGMYNYCAPCKESFEKRNEKKKHTSFWDWFKF
jgi:hypothetical protein